GDSASIDAAVRQLVRDGLSVYRIDTDRLAQLQPDLIVTQDQCEVCAVSYKDVLDDTQRVADAADCHDAGTALVGGLRARLDAIRTRATRVHSRPRVACIEW